MQSLMRSSDNNVRRRCCSSRTKSVRSQNEFPVERIPLERTKSHGQTRKCSFSPLTRTSRSWQRTWYGWKFQVCAFFAYWPSLFIQLYTIHGEIKDFVFVVPLAFICVYVFFMFFYTVILTELSMFCVRLSHVIIKFDLIDLMSYCPYRRFCTFRFSVTSPLSIVFQYTATPTARPADGGFQNENAQQVTNNAQVTAQQSSDHASQFASHCKLTWRSHSGRHYNTVDTGDVTEKRKVQKRSKTSHTSRK